MPLTIQAVQQISGVSPETARRVVALADGSVDPLQSPGRYPMTCRWATAGGARPRANEIAMAAINETLDGFGVDPITPDHGGPGGRAVACYANLGDACAATVVFEYASGDFQVTSLDDYAQALETVFGCRMQFDDGLTIPIPYRR